MKKVGCVVTAYNANETLPDTIFSLLSQSYPISEIVIVDDCSDRPFDLVDVPDTVKVFRNDVNQWVYTSRNIGERALSPEIDTIFFLDSDDIINVDYVKAGVEVMEKESATLVYPNQIRFSGTGPTLRRSGLIAFPEFSLEALKQRNFISYSSLIDRDVFYLVGGYSEFLNKSRNHLAEWELWLRMLRVPGAKFKYCGSDSQMIFCYRTSPDQMSKHYERTRLDMMLEMLCVREDWEGVKNFNTQVQPPIVLLSDKIDDDWKKAHENLSKYGSVLSFFLDASLSPAAMRIRLDAFLAALHKAVVYVPSFGRINEKWYWLVDELVKKETIPVFFNIQAARTHFYYAWQGDIQRYNYQFLENKVRGSESIRLIDLGGYKGEWTYKMMEKYGLGDFVSYVFEPISCFMSEIISNEKFDTSKIAVMPFAAGAHNGTTYMVQDGDASTLSSSWENGTTVVDVMDFPTWVDEHVNFDVDVLKMNIEGGEYVLIDTLFRKNLLHKFNHIQIQFHDDGVNARKLMEECRHMLSCTHDVAWSYDFVFEDWRRKNV